ncbi:multicopper oxidase family protein [Pigmentibacter sp. JX0631]|uniref:multicopper oxidase family protein n=1 Tax=Pigmentibacter sp. JX0631 TaxID=2976982 RepID=UPI0024693522|nr:multicopper oxidase family protein [Pigmentibacter sp. JX0631]WGL59838.1 multicopper oxidase family protein [Pigmentibacter sp. JX0631]
MNKLISLSLSSLVLLSCINLYASEMGHHSPNNKTISTEERFSESINNLNFVKKSQIIKLKDGDSFTLTAAIVKQKIGNKTIRRYAYNGSIPGPLIVVPKNAKIKLKFVNQTDTDQTLHSHGLRLDYRFDGVVGIGQKTPVKPGESFDYELFFPDAGVYWYHPHVREDYSQDMGLYGNYLVKDGLKEEPFNKQISLVLDDVLLSKDAKPYFKDFTNYAAMGRFGNIMLINGIPNYVTEVNKGDVVRLYLTNTSNTRTFQFKIPNVKIKLIAGDASNYEKQSWVDSVTIAPSERYTIDVLFEKEGSFNIESINPQKNLKLGTIKVIKGKSQKDYTKEFGILSEDSEVIKDIDKVRPFLDKKVDKNIALRVKMDMSHAEENPPEIEWEDTMPEMNSMMTSKEVTWQIEDLDTKKMNMDILWKFKKGNYYKIKIFNDPKSNHPMQHPIHFHGQRFLIVTRNGVKTTNYTWKDTALVKTGETVEILLEASNPGKWMSHCHIAEHLSAGMMIGFDVEE